MQVVQMQTRAQELTVTGARARAHGFHTGACTYGENDNYFASVNNRPMFREKNVYKIATIYIIIVIWGGGEKLERKKKN